MRFSLKALMMSGSFLLAACGGGGGGEPPPPPPPPAVTVLNGVFEDSAVSGLEFRTLTQSGVTNSTGRFDYESGEEVSFALGDLALGSEIGKARITPVDLVQDAADAQEPSRVLGVVNVARLLQSLDEDQNPGNGIVISAATRDRAAEIGRTVDVRTANLDTLAELDAVLQAASAQLISVDEAVAHLTQTLNTTGALRLFSVGGSLNGLAGGLQVSLRLSNGDVVLLNSNGNFVFPRARFRSASAYQVSIEAQPANQECQISNAAGTVGSANVTNVTVSCSQITAPSFTIGGDVSGLSGSLRLRNNSSDVLVLQSNGGFVFSERVVDGGRYNVVVDAQPPGQTCSVGQVGSGMVSGADVAGIAVTCMDAPNATFGVSGSVSGLSGVLRLENNGEIIQLSQSGPFAFPTQLRTGDAYNVTVNAQPAGQLCIVSNSMGTVAGLPIVDASVACNNLPRYSVSTQVSGLGSTALVLSLNGSSDLSFNADGTQAFATTLLSGNAYAVSIVQQPADETCSFVNVNASSGTIEDMNVGPIQVTCVPRSQAFSISVQVSGLVGSLELRNSGTGFNDLLPVTSNGTAAFPTDLPQGTSFTVSFVSVPNAQQCQVEDRPIGADFSMVVASADVSLEVQCSDIELHELAVQINGFVLGTNDTFRVRGPSNQELIYPDDLDSVRSLLVFANRVREGDAVFLEILDDPVNHTCAFDSVPTNLGSDTVVVITCSVDQVYQLDVNVNGLEAGGVLVLTENLSQPPEILQVTTAGDSSKSFARDAGTTYELVVEGPATNQTCNPSAGAQLQGILNANTSVDVDCDQRVGVSVTGLPTQSPPSSLQIDIAGNILSFTDSVQSPVPLRYVIGASIPVSVTQQPVGSACQVDGLFIVTSEINVINVTCGPLVTLDGQVSFDLERKAGNVIVSVTPTVPANCQLDPSIVLQRSIRVIDGTPIYPYSFDLPRCAYDVTLSSQNFAVGVGQEIVELLGGAIVKRNKTDYQARCVFDGAAAENTTVDLAGGAQTRNASCGIDVSALGEGVLQSCVANLLSNDSDATFPSELSATAGGTLECGNVFGTSPPLPRSFCEVTPPAGCASFDSKIDVKTMFMLMTFSSAAKINLADNYVTDSDLACPIYDRLDAFGNGLVQVVLDFESRDGTPTNDNYVCYQATLNTLGTDAPQLEVPPTSLTANPLYLNIDFESATESYNALGSFALFYDQILTDGSITPDGSVFDTPGQSFRAVIPSGGVASVRIDPLSLKSGVLCKGIVDPGVGTTANVFSDLRRDSQDSSVVNFEVFDGVATLRNNNANLTIRCEDAVSVEIENFAPPFDPIQPETPRNIGLMFEGNDTDRSLDVPVLQGSVFKQLPFMDFLNGVWDVTCFGASSSGSLDVGIRGVPQVQWSGPQYPPTESAANGCTAFVALTDDNLPEPELQLAEGYARLASRNISVDRQVFFDFFPGPSSSIVAEGNSIEVFANAFGSQGLAEVSYAWSDTCSDTLSMGFADPTLASTRWTAPSAIDSSGQELANNCELTVVATDTTRASRSATFGVRVEDDFRIGTPRYEGGNLNLGWTPNRDLGGTESTQYTLQARLSGDAGFTDTEFQLAGPFSNDDRLIAFGFPLHLNADIRSYRMRAEGNTNGIAFSTEVDVAPSQVQAERLPFGRFNGGLNLRLLNSPEEGYPIFPAMARNGQLVATGIPDTFDGRSDGLPFVPGRVVVNALVNGRWKDIEYLSGFKKGSRIALTTSGSAMIVGSPDNDTSRFVLAEHDPVSCTDISQNCFTYTPLNIDLPSTLDYLDGDLISTSPHIVIRDPQASVFVAAYETQNAVFVGTYSRGGGAESRYTLEASALEIPSCQACKQSQGRALRVSFDDNQFRGVVETSDGIVLLDGSNFGDWIPSISFSNTATELLINPVISGDGNTLAFVVLDADSQEFRTVRVVSELNGDAPVSADTSFAGVFGQTSSVFAPGAGAFGTDPKISIDFDGDVLVLGASGDDVRGTNYCTPAGINCGLVDDDDTDSGAAFVFQRTSANQWEHTTYIKPPKSYRERGFGAGVHLSDDAETLLISHPNIVGDGGLFVH